MLTQRWRLFEVGTLVAPLEDSGTCSATSDELSSAFNELLREVEDPDALDDCIVKACSGAACPVYS